MSKKFDADADVQAYVQKKVDQALKADRKRIIAVMKDIQITVVSKKEANQIARKFKEEVAAPTLQ